MNFLVSSWTYSETGLDIPEKRSKATNALSKVQFEKANPESPRRSPVRYRDLRSEEKRECKSETKVEDGEQSVNAGVASSEPSVTRESVSCVSHPSPSPSPSISPSHILSLIPCNANDVP